jgi:hypothetical protein
VNENQPHSSFEGQAYGEDDDNESDHSTYSQCFVQDFVPPNKSSSTRYAQTSNGSGRPPKGTEKSHADAIALDAVPKSMRSKTILGRTGTSGSRFTQIRVYDPSNDVERNVSPRPPLPPGANAILTTSPLFAEHSSTAFSTHDEDNDDLSMARSVGSYASKSSNTLLRSNADHDAEYLRDPAGHLDSVERQILKAANVDSLEKIDSIRKCESAIRILKERLGPNSSYHKEIVCGFDNETQQYSKAKQFKDHIVDSGINWEQLFMYRDASLLALRDLDRQKLLNYRIMKILRHDGFVRQDELERSGHLGLEVNQNDWDHEPDEHHNSDVSEEDDTFM